MKLWRTQYYTGPHSGRSARSSPKATSNLGKPNYRLPTPRTVTFLYAPCREVLADGVDRKRRQTKEELITPHASGSSLILVRHYHVGHGRTANYLDKGRATKYVALEPNTLTYPHIRRITNQAGFTEADGSLLILSCGAEDTNLTYLDIVLVEWASSRHYYLSSHIPHRIPSPEHTIYSLPNSVLKSGGQFLFYEHVKSDFEDVSWWQSFWAPVWSLAFDGCRTDRPSHIWVDRVRNDAYEGGEVWKRENLEE